MVVLNLKVGYHLHYCQASPPGEVSSSGTFYDGKMCFNKNVMNSSTPTK